MSSPIVAPLFDSRARIFSLLGPIAQPDINLTVDHLLRLDGESSASITLFVSCQGGGIVDGLKVLDTLSLLRSPVTGVGLGFIEGAGALILSACTQRILYPSCLVSWSGLWDLPQLHHSARRPMGLRDEPNLESRLQMNLVRRLKDVIATPRGKIPRFFADPLTKPEVLSASDCLRLGLADAIVQGPERTLTQPIIHNSKNEPTSSFLSTLSGARIA